MDQPSPTVTEFSKRRQKQLETLSATALRFQLAEQWKKNDQAEERISHLIEKIRGLAQTCYEVVEYEGRLSSQHRDVYVYDTLRGVLRDASHTSRPNEWQPPRESERNSA